MSLASAPIPPTLQASDAHIRVLRSLNFIKSSVTTQSAYDSVSQPGVIFAIVGVSRVVLNLRFSMRIIIKLTSNG